MNNELKQFCENYEVTVLNDQKRRARYYPPNGWAYDPYYEFWVKIN